MLDSEFSRKISELGRAECLRIISDYFLRNLISREDTSERASKADVGMGRRSPSLWAFRRHQREWLGLNDV